MKSGCSLLLPLGTGRGWDTLWGARTLERNASPGDWQPLSPELSGGPSSLGPSGQWGKATAGYPRSAWSLSAHTTSARRCPDTFSLQSWPRDELSNPPVPSLWRWAGGPASQLRPAPGGLPVPHGICLPHHGDQAAGCVGQLSSIYSQTSVFSKPF